MTYATLYRTRIWLTYVWCEVTNWLDYVPAYVDDDFDLRTMKHELSKLIHHLDVHFFNIYGQEEALERRKELVKKLEWKTRK